MDTTITMELKDDPRNSRILGLGGEGQKCTFYIGAPLRNTARLYSSCFYLESTPEPPGKL